LRIAAPNPCRDEAVGIAEVGAEFRRALPEARVYAYDNNSTDAIASLATRAGAPVRREKRQGIRNVVRRMFADIEADAAPPAPLTTELPTDHDGAPVATLRMVASDGCSRMHRSTNRDIRDRSRRLVDPCGDPACIGAE
jgi:hypothetical protein